jgi:hypothetical protein
MAVNVSATFRKDEREFNGLEAIRQELIDQPLVRHLVVAEVETIRLTTDVRDGGVITPTIKLVTVEPLEGDAAREAKKLLDEAYHLRTGQTAPPPTLFGDGVDVEMDDGEGGEGDTANGADPAEDAAWPGDADVPKRSRR